MANTQLLDAIGEIIDEIKTISGIRSAPDEPPESTDLFPFVVVYPGSGVYEVGNPIGYTRALHNIVIELHVARKDLPRNYSTVMSLIDEIPIELGKLLKASGFSDLSTFESIEYSFLPMSYGGVDTLGVQYTITDVKIQVSLV